MNDLIGQTKKVPTEVMENDIVVLLNNIFHSTTCMNNAIQSIGEVSISHRCVDPEIHGGVDQLT